MQASPQPQVCLVAGPGASPTREHLATGRSCLANGISPCPSTILSRHCAGVVTGSVPTARGAFASGAPKPPACGTAPHFPRTRPPSRVLGHGPHLPLWRPEARVQAHPAHWHIPPPPTRELARLPRSGIQASFFPIRIISLHNQCGLEGLAGSASRGTPSKKPLLSRLACARRGFGGQSVTTTAALRPWPNGCSCICQCIGRAGGPMLPGPGSEDRAQHQRADREMNQVPAGESRVCMLRLRLRHTRNGGSMHRAARRLSRWACDLASGFAGVMSGPPRGLPLGWGSDQ